MSKVSLVTGITGMDGVWLARLLLDKGHQVHGIVRRSSAPNTHRLVKILANELGTDRLKLHHGDLTDSISLNRIVGEVRPDELYNLAAQSHVLVSFETPEYTANADGLGTLRLLEAIRANGLIGKTRFYQASTSELYGKVQEIPQKETTPFYPRSPYGVAKLYAYWITVNYREAYDMHASNGILFNHEGELRGELFVTRKVTKTVAKIACGEQEALSLGNLDAQRDWGDSRDYVRGMYLMMQQEQPDDYVLATGEVQTVRNFVTLAFEVIGRSIEWSGQGLDEVGRDAKTGEVLVNVDPKYFRPTEVEILIGDPTKARTRLGWRHTTSFPQLVTDMVTRDLERQKKIAAADVFLEDFV